VINREIIGSLEIAHKLGAKLIVVKGHSSCGAVGLALANEAANSVGSITGKIRRAVEDCGCGAHGTKGGHADGKAMLDQVARQNVENSLADIIEGSAFLREKITRCEMGLVGAFHDIATSTVHFGELVMPSDFDRYRRGAVSLAA